MRHRPHMRSCRATLSCSSQLLVRGEKQCLVDQDSVWHLETILYVSLHVLGVSSVYMLATKYYQIEVSL